MDGGKPNPEYWRAMFGIISKQMVRAAMGEIELKGFNFSQAKDMMAWGVKALHGMEPEHLIDSRSPTEKAEDLRKSMLDDPDSVFEGLDEALDEMERQMDNADRECADYLKVGTLARTMHDVPTTGLTPQKKRERARAWLDRIRRIRRVRDRARKPIPSRSDLYDDHEHALKAAQPLRFMAYVGRTPDGKVLRVARHHAEISCAIYEARNGLDFSIPGEVEDGYPYIGALIVTPPGHGKSVLATHTIGLWLYQNPRLRVVIGHAQKGEAEKDLAYITGMFDPEKSDGRRARSLFPDCPPIVRKNERTMTLWSPHSVRQPTIKAHGILSKISGADADILWFDDPVDQELAEQDVARDRVFNRMNATWRTRKRGKAAFELTTTTLWHHDDPNVRRIRLQREAKICLRVKIMSCGGPESSPPFRPLWPEMYPESWLRAKYKEWRNPKLYAATYECNPTHDSTRKIKRLRYYDPRTDAHTAFAESAIIWLSCDPTGKDKQTSDMAVILRAGINDVSAPDGSSTRRVLRVLDARRFHSSQVELVHHIVAACAAQTTHHVVVEECGATSATVQLLLEMDFPVDPYQPKNRRKEWRLEDVSPLLDDSMADKGLCHAAVEFPGAWVDNDGSRELMCHPEYEWLATQILDFGIVNEDDGVDAVTQLLIKAMPYLDVTGAVPTVVAQQIVGSSNPAIARWVKGALKPVDRDTLEGRDLAGFSEVW